MDLGKEFFSYSCILLAKSLIFGGGKKKGLDLLFSFQSSPIPSVSLNFLRIGDERETFHPFPSLFLLAYKCFLSCSKISWFLNKVYLSLILFPERQIAHL